jgi:TRAP-type C4-dicarboxylate transport system permease small subunit
MRARLEQFLAFFITTFLLANFVFGSLRYVFEAHRRNPGLDPDTMLWIAAATAICGVIMTVRAS